MILSRLQISGFLSYNDKVEIDFSGFDLACISGANGAGKSSLLEAITWVLFGEARRRDDAVINHHAKTAEVILDFVYEGTAYQVQRSKTLDKSAILEFRIGTGDGKWKPLTEATMRSTEELIRNVLHLDYETFINSAFFLQGRADQFAQQKPGDRKRILSGILGLDVWELYKEEASLQRRGFESRVNAVDERLKEIEEELKQEGERKKRLSDLEKELTSHKALFEARKALLDQQRLINDRATHEKTTLDKQLGDIQLLRNELDNTVDSLHQRMQEQKEFQQEISAETQVREAVDKWEAARQALSEWEKVASNFHQYDSQRKDLQMKLDGERIRLESEQKTLILLAEKMAEVQIQLPTLQQVLQDCEARKTQLIQSLDLRALLETEMQALRDEKVRASSENEQITLEGTDLNKKVLLLQESRGALCPTCEKPLNSAERHRLLDDLNLRLGARREKYAENQQTVKNCDEKYREKETQLLTLKQAEALLKLEERNFDSTSSEIDRKQKELAEWDSSGKVRLEQLQEVLRAQSYQQDTRAELNLIDQQLKALGYDTAAHETLRQEELAGRTCQEQLTRLEKAKTSLTHLEREIGDLEANIDKNEKRLAKITEEHKNAEQKFRMDYANLPDISQIENECESLQLQMNETQLQVGYSRSNVDVLDKLRVNKTGFLEEKQGVIEKIANLKTLERAFGKDGIPAMLIEQALPEIQEHTNNILDRLSNGGMSVSFETQREFKDKKREDRRETLDILIRDAAGIRAYELFSGGEAFRINFAIRMALSRVLARRAGARLQTLVIDEGFGSQDADGRQRLIEAINLARADFAKVLVITHLEDMKDAFSARIEVSKTPSGSQVEVVAA